LCGYYPPEKFSLCLGVLVVRPMHTDFTTEAQRHKDEEEIVSPGLPTENSEEPEGSCPKDENQYASRIYHVKKESCCFMAL